MSPILIAVIVISSVGLLGAVILVVASKILAVKVDERVEAITEVLPGANCGSCGFAGCAAYAQAVVDGAAPNLCVAGGASTAKKVADVMGTDAGEVVARKAFVGCRGSNDCVSKKFEYHGVPTCAACNTVYNGDSTCPFGCLGYGDCVKACKFGAISVVDGLARVDKDKCTGCGACLAACPKRVIYMYNDTDSDKPIVMCASHEGGKNTRVECKAGCIGCGKCVRGCPSQAITLHNFVARIDYTKCTGCGNCVSECNFGCITFVNK